jgi:hypothetical protein
MSAEMKDVLKFNLDTVVIKRFKVADLNGLTSFTLAESSYEMRDSEDGSVVKSGTAVVNNADEDLAGNIIKTVSLSIDLTDTDALPVGPYYLVVHTRLTSQQTDFFRWAVELVDLRVKGVA